MTIAATVAQISEDIRLQIQRIIVQIKELEMRKNETYYEQIKLMVQLRELSYAIAPIQKIEAPKGDWIRSENFGSTRTRRVENAGVVQDVRQSYQAYVEVDDYPVPN